MNLLKIITLIALSGINVAFCNDLNLGAARNQLANEEALNTIRCIEKMSKEECCRTFGSEQMRDYARNYASDLMNRIEDLVMTSLDESIDKPESEAAGLWRQYLGLLNYEENCRRQEEIEFYRN